MYECEIKPFSYEVIIAKEKLVKYGAILAGAVGGFLLNLLLRALCMGTIATMVLCFSYAVGLVNDINEVFGKRTGIDPEEIHTERDRKQMARLEIACIVVTIAAGLFAYPLLMSCLK